MDPNKMGQRITRRNLVALAGAMPLTAQPPPPIPSTPDEELKAAHAQNRANAELLNKVVLPMSTEPAIRFKA